jgi:hypothetical protein
MAGKSHLRDPLVNAGNCQLALVLESILNKLRVSERWLFGAVNIILVIKKAFDDEMKIYV